MEEFRVMIDKDRTWVEFWKGEQYVMGGPLSDQSIWESFLIEIWENKENEGK